MSAVLNAPASVAMPWRRALAALGLLLAAIVLLYRDTFGAMVAIWLRSDTFAHAIMVAPITLWLIWRRRSVLMLFTPRPQPWLLLPMALVAAVWLLGDLAGVNALTQFCVTALLILAVPAVLGVPVARQIAFPLGFLLFMVPFGDFLLPLMMEATADFTVAAVAFSGVPVYREGLQFVIPTGAWSVVEACSGVRYLIASFMVGTLFAYLNYSTLQRRLLFCLAAILVPVLANWLRAYMIVMLGHLSGNTIAVGVDHLIYGWVFFGVIILLMFVVGSRWSEPEAVVTLPAQIRNGQTEPVATGTWALALVAVAFLALPQAAAWQLSDSTDVRRVMLAPPDLPGAAAADSQTPMLSPAFPGAVAAFSRSYVQGDATVTVHVAYFRRQGYGAKLASSQNTLVRLDDERWNQASASNAMVVVADKAVPMRAREIFSAHSLTAAVRKRLDVRQVYWAGGRFTGNAQWASALAIYGRVTGQGDDAAVITIYTEGEDASVTAPRLNAFISAHLQRLGSVLDAARNAR